MGFTEYLHQLPSTFTRYTGLAKADVHHIEMESERKQPSISFFLEGEEKGFSKSSNGQIRNLMYETVKMVGFFFFFFSFYFALPQLLRTRIKYTITFQVEKLLEKD